MRVPLRVGIVVDAPVVPAWVAAVVRDVAGASIATVAALIVCPGRVERPGALYALYTTFDARKFGPSMDPFVPVDIGPLLGGVPRLTLVPRAGDDGDDLDVAAIERTRHLGLDVAVCLRSRPLRGAAVGIARHGVWWYEHGDDRVIRGGPPGFWEVMEGRSVTGSTLRILDEAGGSVIYRSFSSTHPISVRQNQHSVIWQSTAFVMRKLRELHRDGPEVLTDPEPIAARAYSGRVYGTPGNAEMARLAARLAGRYLARKVRDTFGYRQWALAYALGTPPLTDKEPVPELVLPRFQILTPPPDRLWADPFPVQADGRTYILLEEALYATGKGHIAVMALDEDGTPSAPVPVLERDYHLSYPFVFEWEGAQYMVPETAANGTVDLYRATRFPYEWTLERTLMADTQLVDATLADIGGRWWMFANAPAVPEADYDGMYWDELHLFVADSPLGPWMPHPRNPIVSDVRRSRSAGRLFQQNGLWYRPAQSCAGRYGAALSLQRITRLDPEGYEETPAVSLTPWRRGLSGMHTLNAVPGLTVVDVALERRRHPFARGRVGPR